MRKKYILIALGIFLFIVLRFGLLYELIYPPYKGIECARALHNTIGYNKIFYRDIIEYFDTLQTNYKKIGIERIKNSVGIDERSTVVDDSLEERRPNDQIVLPDYVKQSIITSDTYYVLRDYVNVKHIIFYPERFSDRRLVGNFKIYYFPEGYRSFKFGTKDLEKSLSEKTNWHFKIDSNWVVEKYE